MSLRYDLTLRNLHRVQLCMDNTSDRQVHASLEPNVKHQPLYYDHTHQWWQLAPCYIEVIRSSVKDDGFGIACKSCTH